MSKKSKKLLKRAFALMLALVIAVPAVDYSMLMTVNATEGGPNEGVAAIAFSGDSKGYEEGAYVKWSPVDGANGYQVYVSSDENVEENAENLIDDELIRKYPDYYRADVLGLTEGTWYVKVVAGTFDAGKNRTAKKAEGVKAVEVTSHDRSGFAWQGYNDDEKDNNNINTPGAYKKDGSLKDDTSVIYVTNANKNAVTLKGDDDTEYVGLQNILNAYKSLKLSKPLDVRIIGNIEDFDIMDGGDIAIENGRRAAAGITIEGIGDDAVANGWGIRILNASNVEVRNLGFMNCDSVEGDNVGVQQNNDHVWVHNCDFFYGEAGNDEDQKKGDGMLDCKKSDWVTFSYNHFWDSGKSCLLGLEENSNEYHATYHHNWFDHSDSRHPRVRFYTTHVYNNYYDGNSKYGIGGAAGGASIFAENNYFRNCKYPMIISMQGSDTGTLSSEEGSIIKAYGNCMTGQTSYIPYQANSAVSESREEEAGFVTYIAFDDDASVKSGVTDAVDAAEDSTVIPEEIADSEIDEDAEKEDTEASDNDDVSVGENVSDEYNMADEETEDSDAGEAPDDDAVDSDMDGSAADDETPNMDFDETETEILDDDTIADYGDAEVSYANSGDASIDFDAYEASSRDEKVPDTVKAKNGGHTYNNFDTTPGFYTYKLDETDKVKEIVKESAGRINGGDFPGTAFSFNDSDDKSSSLNQALKDLCTNYMSSLVAVGGVANETATIYYTVTFDPGNGESVHYVRVEAGSLIEKPDEPTVIPEGKVKLDGWFNVYRKWDFDNDTVTGNITLVAQWLAEGETESGYGLTPIGTETIVHSLKREEDRLESPYFEFTGDYDTQAGNSGAYMGLQYLSSRGRLNLKGGGKVSFVTTTPFTLVLLLNATQSKNHYLFNGSTRSTIVSTNAVIEAKNLSAGSYTVEGKDTDYLYAIIVIPDGSEFVYDDLKYNINIDLDGGTSTVTSPLAISKGYSITREKLPNPIKDGFIFQGWVDESGKAVRLPYKPSGDMKLKATWKTAETYTVNIDLDGGTSDTIPSSLTVYAGDSIDLSKLGTPTREKHTFQGWFDADDQKLGDTYTPTGDTTIKAGWKANTNVGADNGNIKITIKDAEDYEDGIAQYTYTGTAIKPEIIVTNSLNDKVLVEGVDYTVKYSNNVKPSTDSKRASITVTGKGIYAGKSNPKLFTIEKKDISDTDNIKAGRIVVIKNQQAKLPILYYGSIKLTSKDIKFKNGNVTFNGENENEKTTITGIGNNFTGEREIDVLVVADSKAAKAAAEKFTVELNKTALNSVKYTGNDLREQIKACITKVSDKKTGTALEANQYEIAFPDNVTDAGTVKFTIVGLDKYSGCNVVKSCKIQPKAIADADVVLAEKTENTDGKMVLTGMIGTPPYKSTGATYDGLTLAWNYKDADDIPQTLPLTEGKDYKISYSGNKKASATPDSAKLTVTFKGNYKGKSVKKFSIGKAELSTETVSEDDILIADKVSKGKEGIYKSAPIVSMDGVTVKASEYDVAYYQDAGFTTPMDKDHKLKFTNITADKPYVTVYVKITAKAKSKNYKTTDGEKAIKGSYKVWVKKSNEVDLTKAKVVFYKDEAGKTKTSKLEYTGDVVVPGKVVVMIGKTEVSGDKYECKIINNVNKGKATVLVYAKDESGCIGAKTATYSIVSHSLNGFSW